MYQDCPCLNGLRSARRKCGQIRRGGKSELTSTALTSLPCPGRFAAISARSVRHSDAEQASQNDMPVRAAGWTARLIRPRQATGAVFVWCHSRPSPAPPLGAAQGGLAQADRAGTGTSMTDYADLPTARTTLRARYVRLRFRCAHCGHRKIDAIVVPADAVLRPPTSPSAVIAPSPISPPSEGTGTDTAPL